MDIVEGADHTFMARGSQRTLATLLTQRLVAQLALTTDPVHSRRTSGLHPR
ncbi:MAG TPA: hypothetical protein VGT98_03610 [Candidatus Elarobacter sp.]|nr:hypothetical protein [Candidatus Elarobacter sp.]